MILESGGIPSREQKGAPKSYTKRKAFKDREVGSPEEKHGLFLARSPPFGGQKGSIRWITSLVLTKKFQTDWLRLLSEGRLKLQIS